MHPSIRWAALTSDANEIVFCQMREGVETHTSDAEDRALIQMVPLFVTGAAQELATEGKAGNLEGIIVCFKRAYVLMVKLKEGGYLAISLKKEDALLVFNEIMPEINKLTQLIQSIKPKSSPPRG